VSYTKKLVTAVTAASLLASIFGSSVLAAGRGTVDPVVKSAYTTYQAAAAVQRTTATSKVFGFQSSASTATVASATAAIGIQIFSDGAAGAGNTVFDFGTDLKLEATSSNSAVKVAWAYDNAGDAAACTALDGVGALTTFGASDVVIGVDPTANLVVVDPVLTQTYKLCLAAASATTAGTSTITVKAGGAVAGTFTVTAVGPVASVTLSGADGGLRIAEDNGAVDNFWQIVAKDAAGVIINGASNSVSDEELDFIEYSENPDNADGDTITILTDGTVAQSNGATAASMNQFSLEAAVCDADTGTAAAPDGNGDAGNSYSVRVAFDAATDVVSNAVSIVCTGGYADMSVTSMSVDATTGGGTYEDANGGDDIFVKLGLNIGAGLTIVPADVYTAPTTATVAAALTWSATDNDDLVTDGNGKITIGDLSPTGLAAKEFGYSFTAIVNAGAFHADPTITKVTKKYSFSYDATGDEVLIVPTVTYNKLRTTATIKAACGYSDSRTIVDIEVTRADGSVVTYKRRADKKGLVSLVLSARKTSVEAIVMCTDGDSEIALVTYR
jgi:hypothetical protein